MIRLIAISLLTLFVFSGCLGVKKEEVPVPVYKTKLIKLTPPKELIEPEIIPEPPDKVLFINSSNLERLEQLTKYTKELLKTLYASNNKLNNLSKWSKTVDKEIEEVVEDD